MFILNIVWEYGRKGLIDDIYSALSYKPTKDVPRGPKSVINVHVYDLQNVIYMQYTWTAPEIPVITVKKKKKKKN